MVIKIKRLTSDTPFDLEDINKLLIQLSPGNSRRSIGADELHEVLSNPLFHMIVAVERKNSEQEHIVAMATMFFQRNVTGWIAEIHDIVVDEDYRGSGLGRTLNEQLLETAYEFCREKGIKLKLYLTSRPNRVAANSLYEKLGFVLVAKSFGPWGTNLYKIIVEPKDLQSI